MEISHVLISDLIEANYNPRLATQSDYNDMRESLKRFGCVIPIVVNQHKTRKNIVVGGHLRLAIMRELGYESAPCVFVDLPLKHEQELNIRLNENGGEWDFDKLANYFNVSDLIEYGFDESEFMGSSDITETFDDKKNKAASFYIEIKFNNNDELMNAYEELVNMGYDCKAKIT